MLPLFFTLAACKAICTGVLLLMVMLMMSTPADCGGIRRPAPPLTGRPRPSPTQWSRTGRRQDSALKVIPLGTVTQADTMQSHHCILTGMQFTGSISSSVPADWIRPNMNDRYASNQTLQHRFLCRLCHFIRHSILSAAIRIHFAIAQTCFWLKNEFGRKVSGDE